MESGIRQRSMVVSGHKVNLCVEDQVWQGLEEAADERCLTVVELIDEIDRQRRAGSLSSAIRVFVLEYYRARRAQQNFAGVISGLGTLLQLDRGHHQSSLRSRRVLH